MKMTKEEILQQISEWRQEIGKGPTLQEFERALQHPAIAKHLHAKLSKIVKHTVWTQFTCQQIVAGDICTPMEEELIDGVRRAFAHLSDNKVSTDFIVQMCWLWAAIGQEMPSAKRAKMRKAQVRSQLKVVSDDQ